MVGRAAWAEHKATLRVRQCEAQAGTAHLAPPWGDLQHRLQGSAAVYEHLRQWSSGPDELAAAATGHRLLARALLNCRHHLRDVDIKTLPTRPWGPEGRRHVHETRWWGSTGSAVAENCICDVQQKPTDEKACESLGAPFFLGSARRWLFPARRSIGDLHRTSETTEDRGFPIQLPRALRPIGCAAAGAMKGPRVAALAAVLALLAVLTTADEHNHRVRTRGQRSRRLPCVAASC